MKNFIQSSKCSIFWKPSLSCSCWVFLLPNWWKSEEWSSGSVCTLSWTSARSNHKAIIAISASPSSALVQLPGAICEAAEQEMMCCREPRLGRLVDYAGSPPPPLQADSVWVIGGGGTGTEDQTRIYKVLVIDRDITGPQIYYWPKSWCHIARWLMGLCDMFNIVLLGGCLVLLSSLKSQFPCCGIYKLFTVIETIMSALVLVIRTMSPLFTLLHAFESFLVVPQVTNLCLRKSQK